MNKTQTQTQPQTQPEAATDYANAVDLLALYTEATNRLAQIETEANDELVEILDEKKADYALYQEKLAQAESALEALAKAHPEWFAGAKSIKTPYGSLKYHASKKIVIANEEATLAKIDLKEARDKSGQFKAADFTRSTRTVNIEAMEDWTDAQLAEIGAERVSNNNFSVKPAKLDMGKALKARAAEQSEAAAKTQPAETRDHFPA